MSDFSFFGLFGAGLLTFLSPCVLPLAPIWIGSVSGGGKQGRFHRVISTAWFAFGFSLVFVLFGLSIPAITQLIGGVKSALLAFGAVVMILFGLKLSGSWDFTRVFKVLGRSLHFPAAARLEKIGGPLRPLLFGAVFGLSWTPCVGPVLGGVLTYVASAQASSLRGAQMLFVFAAGISLPLLILAAGLDRLSPLLKRFNRFLPKVEYATGFALILFGAYVLGQTSNQVLSRYKAAEQAALTVMDWQGHEIAVGDPQRSGGAKMLFFYTDQCPVCRSMKGFLPGIEQDCNSDSFQLVRVNVGDLRNSPAADRFQVHAVPTISVLNSAGDEVVRLVGFQTESRLREAAKAVGQVVCKNEVEKLLEKAPVPTFDESQGCHAANAC